MGRTLKRPAGDILAYFDHPHTSNGPTEAINGRLEHLGGIAQGFVNPHHYRLRCLALRPTPTPPTPLNTKSPFIIAILVGIIIVPMLPLEYRDRVIAVLAHPLYYLGLGSW